MNTEELLESSKKLVNEIHRTTAVVEQCRNLEASINDMQIVFADAERKNIADVCMVLSAEQEKNLKQIIIRNIVMNRENAEKKLAELTGSGKPAEKETGNTGHSAADRTALTPDSSPVKEEDRGKRKAVSAEEAEERIRKIREMVNAGMSQAEIARKLDISPGRVWQLIRQHGIRPAALPEPAAQDAAEEKPPAVREKVPEPDPCVHSGKEQAAEDGQPETKVKKQFTRKELTDFGLNVKPCAHCGKDIIRSSFDGYVYKRHGGGKMHYFCSWSCFKADERKKKDSYCY